MAVNGAAVAARDPVECLADLLYADECCRLIDAILIHHLDYPVPVDPDQFRDELQQSRIRGVISRDEYQQIRAIDAAAYDAAERSAITEYAVVEVSPNPNRRDIDLAARRCALVRRATGIAARAFCIAGKPWPETLSDYAAGKGVTVIFYRSKYDQPGA